MSEPSQPRRGVSAILIVSLCFNFFLAGIVVLGTLRAIARGPAAVPIRQLLMPQAVKLLLAGDEQGKLDDIIARHRDALKKFRDSAVAARATSFRDFDAANFDAAKFARDLDAVHAADGALEKEAMTSIAETAAALTPRERQSVSDRLRHELWLAHWKQGRPAAP
ncbi:MAG: periplasmic heavy metal sensor [Rhizomicrobium sp.]|jgi:uncharacterized membrane protein